MPSPNFGSDDTSPLFLFGSSRRDRGDSAASARLPVISLTVDDPAGSARELAGVVRGADGRWASISLAARRRASSPLSLSPRGIMHAGVGWARGDEYEYACAGRLIFLSAANPMDGRQPDESESSESPPQIDRVCSGGSGTVGLGLGLQLEEC